MFLELVSLSEERDDKTTGGSFAKGVLDDEKDSGDGEHQNREQMYG